MAPKRQRGESSGSFDSNKFVSAATQELYHNVTSKRSLVKERGLAPDRIAEIMVNIRDRKWETFTQQPEAAVIPIVREFYANAKEHQNFQVLVRGKLVSFDRATINRYYGLPNINHDDYSEFLTREDKWDVVMNYLATPGTTWKIINGEVAHFPSRALTRDSKAWHYFIGAKLMPVKHFSDVYRDRAALIYAIENRLSIDVGKIVRQEIVRCINAPKMALYFPSMIMGLCKAAGVTWGPDEDWDPPLALIDFNQYFHIKDREGQSRRTRSSAPAPPPSHPAAAPPPSTAEPPPSSSTAMPPTSTMALEEHLSQLQLQAHQSHQDVRRMRSELRRMRSAYSALEDHQVSFQAAMAHNFALMADHLGIDPASRVPFPTWHPGAGSSGAYSGEIPSDDDDDDDEGDGDDAATDPMPSEEN